MKPSSLLLGHHEQHPRRARHRHRQPPVPHYQLPPIDIMAPCPIQQHARRAPRAAQTQCQRAPRHVVAGLQQLEAHQPGGADAAEQQGEQDEVGFDVLRGGRPVEGREEVGIWQYLESAIALLGRLDEGERLVSDGTFRRMRTSERPPVWKLGRLGTLRTTYR